MNFESFTPFGESSSYARRAAAKIGGLIVSLSATVLCGHEYITSPSNMGVRELYAGGTVIAAGVSAALIKNLLEQGDDGQEVGRDDPDPEPAPPGSPEDHINQDWDQLLRDINAYHPTNELIDA